MKSNFRAITFRFRLRLILFAFAMLPMTGLITAVFYYLSVNYTRFYKAEYESVSNELVAGIEKNAEMFARNLFYTSALPELYAYLYGKRSTDLVDTVGFYYEMKRALQTIYQTNPYYYFITIYAEDDRLLMGDIIQPLTILPETELVYIDMYANDSTITYLTEDGRYLKHFRVINAPSGRLGIVESAIPVGLLFNRSPAYDDIVVALHNPVLNGYTDIKDNRAVDVSLMEKDYLVIEKKTRDHLQLMFFIKRAPLDQTVRNYYLLAGMLILLTGAAVFVVVGVTSGTLTRKLYKLTNSVTFQGTQVSFESGPSNQLDEFSQLEDAFRTLADNLNTHIDAEIQLRKDNQKLALELLQALFNPHFLYNTLSAIKIASRDSHVGQVIDSLVRYYRINLSKGRDIISLGEEMDMLREYVSIQQFAYDIDFGFTCEADEEVRGCAIPKLTLQPFVENAVLHGINGVENGQVAITAKQSGDCVQIIIRDNGVGMSPEEVERLTTGSGKGQYSGYGVVNAMRRLSIFFPEKSGVNISSEHGAGTEVIVRIPRFM